MFANQGILEEKNAYVFSEDANDLTLLNPKREVMPDQLELESRGLS
jgi:hypothetical protein